MALGRPRAFDIDTALNRALEVFWSKGFDGASLTDLTDAMGISRPSLYAAFGNKEDLFRKALDRYKTEKMAYINEALAAPTARTLAERLLFGAATMLTDPSHPVGCLSVKGAMTCKDDSLIAREELDQLRCSFETAIIERLTRAIADGDLPPDSNPLVLQRFLGTVAMGMSLQASQGATTADLMAVARMALTAWPALR